jgi:hypothetical protein
VVNVNTRREWKKWRDIVLSPDGPRREKGYGAGTAALRLVARVLSDFYYDQKDYIWTTAGVLSRKCGLSERQIRTTLDALDGTGWISRERPAVGVGIVTI